MSNELTCDTITQGTIHTTRDEAAFQAERRSGVGGSDIHHVLNLPPYGCSLRLWHEKRGHPPDHPVETKGVLERGQKLEELVVREYEEHTGRETFGTGEMVRHPDFPELMVHADRMIRDPELGPGPGVLEAKTAGREVFQRMKREGLPEAHICQLQHGMFVRRTNWGAFGVLHPDSWRFLCWDVQADRELQARIKDEALAFWARVENGPAPERLEPKSPQCARCPYRTSCQGEALLALCKEASPEGEIPFVDIGALLGEYWETKEIAEEAEALLDDAKDAIREALGEQVAADAPGARLYYRPQTSLRWDGKRLALHYEALCGAVRRLVAGLLIDSVSDGGKAVRGNAEDILAASRGVSEMMKPAVAFQSPSVSRPLRIYPR